jgi:putative DNA primase/helicase
MTEVYTTSPKVRVAVNPDGIPDTFKEYDHWALWKAVPKENNKLDKVPYSATRSGRKASSTDSRTWATFCEVLEAYETGGYDGVGFMLSSGDPYTGIDLDSVRDPETGEVEAWALSVIKAFPDAYAEASPSGRGVHIIARGKSPKNGKRTAEGRTVEIYSAERFFTVTGVAL